MSAKETYIDEDGVEVDQYGNPVSGDEIIYCCFPDCGCDGARLCMARKGPSRAAQMVNLERRNLPMLTGERS